MSTDFAAARLNMVESQIRTADVTDLPLQDALRVVARETLVPAAKAYLAYADVDIEYAPGRWLLRPREVGKLLQTLKPREGEKALAIAAPYAAALLARMGLAVTAQESGEAVFGVVGEALAAEGVATAVQPLSQPTGENWDLIVSEGGIQALPDSWGAALRPGGRIVVVERRGAIGKAALFVKTPEGLSRRELFDSSPAVLAELTPAPTFAL